MSETTDCLLKWRNRQNTESNQCTQNSRQPISNTQNDFQSLVCIIAGGLIISIRSISLLTQGRVSRRDNIK